jgi:hypothetical protein
MDKQYGMRKKTVQHKKIAPPKNAVVRFLLVNGDEANFQHIQHSVQLQGVVLGFCQIFAAFGNGMGFQNRQFLGVWFQSAHLQPLVKG